MSQRNFIPAAIWVMSYLASASASVTDTHLKETSFSVLSWANSRTKKTQLEVSKWLHEL